MGEQLSVGGIVLSGGESRRMGRSKAMLPFGPESMLVRVVRILSEVVQPIVVVAARDQQLPELPKEVHVAHDREPGRGPLEGLAAGLAALENVVEAAYVTSCDVPLLKPAFVQALVQQLQDYDAVVPVDEQFQHALAAVYRTRVLPVIGELLANNQLRSSLLFERVNTCRVNVQQLQVIDPDLESLMNLNQWNDYREALRRAGFAEPT